jgi:coenzyme F420-0:L-glutamate ligase/coenzyme F420-1:gamma-L-glutamate ligase
MSSHLEVFPIPGIPEIKRGDNLARIILESATMNEIILEDGDILVIAQKIVSKAEGCVHNKRSVEVTSFAEQMSKYTGHEPEYMELVLRQSKRIVRMANGIVISQTHHGFIMANSGVDSSNSGGKNMIVTLPQDPDKSARQIKKSLDALSGKKIAVIISDTFGRPWRNGQVNMAVGIAGLKPIVDYRGIKDNNGRTMKATQIAVADELSSAAELVSGKTKKLPVAIIRNYQFVPAFGKAKELIRDETSDIFK